MVTAGLSPGTGGADLSVEGGGGGMGRSIDVRSWFEGTMTR